MVPCEAHLLLLFWRNYPTLARTMKNEEIDDIGLIGKKPKGQQNGGCTRTWLRDALIKQYTRAYVLSLSLFGCTLFPYACQDKDHLKGWSIVHQVSSHGKLPVPNDEDYTFDTNTYDGEFYQADGLQGSFEIVLPGVTTAMEVDNETVDDEDPGDVVLNPKDIQMLERFHLGKDNEEDTEPSDSVAHLDNFDSDDETYDPNHEDYS